MKTNVMFLDCPAYMDEQGRTRCGLPAEVQHRYTVESSSGPLESAKIRCPRGHWFNGPVEFLTWGVACQRARGRKPRRVVPCSWQATPGATAFSRRTGARPRSRAWGQAARRTPPRRSSTPPATTAGAQRQIRYQRRFTAGLRAQISHICRHRRWR
jgi:hypothetical protein